MENRTCICVGGRRWLLMKRRRREGGKVLYIGRVGRPKVGRLAKSAVPFYGEEIGFRVERALKDLGPKQ